MDDAVSAMLQTLNDGFPAVERMAGSRRARGGGRTAAARSATPTTSTEAHRRRVIDGPGGALPIRIYRPHRLTAPPSCSVTVVDSCSATSTVTTASAARWPRTASAVVVSVGYRLAPEHPAPAAAEDAFAAFGGWSNTPPTSASTRADRRRRRQRRRQPRRGDGRCSAATRRLRCPPPRCCCIRCIDPSFDTESYRTRATGYFNTRAAMQWYWQQYLGGDDLPEPPWLVAPARADSHAGLPPAVIVTAELDPLHSEGVGVCAPLARRRSSGAAPRLSRTVPRIPDDDAVRSRRRGPRTAVDRPRELLDRQPGARYDRGADRYDAIVVGAGFAGLYAVHRLATAGLSVLGARSRRRRRRHLVLEPLPRRALRRRKCRLLILFRRGAAGQLDLERAVRRPTGDPGLPRARRRSLRPAAGTTRSTPKSSVRSSTRAAHLAGAHRRRCSSTTGRFLLCATGCLSAHQPPRHPRVRRLRRRGLLHRRLAARRAGLPRQARRRHRHRILWHSGDSAHRRAGRVAGGVPAFTELQRARCPTGRGATTTSQRIRAEYPERAAKSAYAPAGTPHTSNARPAAETDRAANGSSALSQRWAQGGVLFGKTFPDQLTDLAANDVAREFAEATIRDIVDDPARRRRPDPHRPPDRHQANLHRRRLLRRRSTATTPGWSTCAASRSTPITADAVRTACGRATPATRWCSPPDSTR